MTPIVDLHCDLLLFLQMNPARTPYDPICRASHGQMQEGGVRLQTLAIFTYPKKGSVESARKQIEIFRQLPRKYGEHFAFFEELLPQRKEILRTLKDGDLSESRLDPALKGLGLRRGVVQDAESPPSEKVQIVPAFENASGFCEEDEPIEIGLSRLQYLHETLKRILYISLTWDGENRFGGGNGSLVGLKEDGKQLLRWMDGKKIAVDLSHTSDALATDILSFIDKHSLKIPVIASHSNFRSVAGALRNLPDELAKEIIRRGGIIGFNFFAPFVGDKDLLKHLEHGLKLQGENALSFGADFFCDTDFPLIKEKYKTERFFLDGLENSSRYPHVLGLFEQRLGLKPVQLKKIASDNALAFIRRTFSYTEIT